jgi:hypothetical protein
MWKTVGLSIRRGIALGCHSDYTVEKIRKAGS